VLGLATLAAALLGVATASAGPVLVAKANFVQNCAGTSQVCGQPVPLPFTLAALTPIQVDYVPAAGHCSDVRLTISVDGVRRPPEQIAPGGSTTATFGPLQPGAHELLVDATGVLGGCNTGALSSWGGSLTVRAAEALPADVQPEAKLEYDGRAFLVRVQYRLREPALAELCKAGCKARVELRTRTGRRVYAASLKGDGKLVLGTKRGIVLRPGKRVRIDVPVVKAKLLVAEFRTVGKFRRAETRLRVVLATPAGNVTTIRDGTIAVSIARIKSGALPGLASILAL
jgi:hypothetical protein